MADDIGSTLRHGAPAAGLPGHRERLFTVDEFLRLGEAGFLDEPGRYELWSGRIMRAPPPGTRHGRTEAALVRLLNLALDGIGVSPRFLCVQPNAGLQLNDGTFLQPDAAVVSPVDPDTQPVYTPGDVRLCIETAVTSLEDDRTDKRLKYAGAEIPEYWVLDAVGAIVHIFREPSRGDYLSHTEHRAGESVCPLFEPRVSIAVAALF